MISTVRVVSAAAAAALAEGACTGAFSSSAI